MQQFQLKKKKITNSRGQYYSTGKVSFHFMINQFKEQTFWFSVVKFLRTKPPPELIEGEAN